MGVAKNIRDVVLTKTYNKDMRQLEIELSEVKSAYKKLKHDVYYDNSNLYLRK